MNKKRKSTPDRSHYIQRYKCEWENQLVWLKKGRSDTSAMCATCNCELNIGKGGLKDLKRHETTVHHISNVKSVLQSSSIDNFMNKKSSDGVIDAELHWANFVSENNLPLKLSDNFTKLVKTMFPDSNIAKNFLCSRTKTGQLIQQVLGESASKNIVTAMRNSFFTLMIDESTDISVMRQMVIMARICTDERVFTYLYKVVSLEGKATGENLFSVVNSAFQEDHIYWENCISMSSDGARAMVGEFNSVLSRVKKQQKDVWFLHCTCHVSHLAASHASSELPDLCEQLPKDIYTFFKASGKRQDAFKEIQEMLEVECHKILRPCFTRWLAMLQCVERLLEQWSALTVYFDSKMDKKENSLESVRRIKHTLHSDVAKLYFLFLQAVLPRFTKFNTMFQQEKTYVHKLDSEISILLRQFVASFIQFSIIQKTDITSINCIRANQLQNSSLFIGHETTKLLEKDTISVAEKDEFYSNVRCFYEMGTKELYRLLPLNDEVLKSIPIFDPTNKESGDWAKVVTLVKRFPNIVTDKEQDSLNAQFIAYTLWDPPSTFITSAEDIDVYWCKVSQYRENGELCFPTLSKLAKAMLILPHSNADVERVFSKLSLIKTSHRSSLLSPMLNALLHCSTRKHIEDFKPTDEMRRNARKLKK